MTEPQEPPAAEGSMHAGQHPLSVQVVRRLVREQLPEASQAPIEAFRSEGSVHGIFRLGVDRVLRFPLCGSEPELVRAALEAEFEAARELREHLTVPLPQPLHLGSPGAGYPLPWSMWTWLPGRSASFEDASRSTGLARDLAGLLRELRSIDRRGRCFQGAGRGGDLRAVDDWIETCLERSEGLLDVTALGSLWARLRDLPGPGEESMTHGDLMPGNLLVESGRMVGLLDLATYGPADGALDLVCAWHLLEAQPRSVLRTELGPSELEWERGRAWAFAQAIGLVWYYERSNPVLSLQGRRTLERLLADPA